MSARSTPVRSSPVPVAADAAPSVDPAAPTPGAGTGSGAGGGRPLPPGYRGLRVWQRAMDLTADVYALTRPLLTAESIDLAAHLRKASTSVATHIAEGNARSEGREYAERIAGALSGVAEVETLASLALRLGYVTELGVAPTLAQCGDLTRMLRALQKVLQPGVVPRGVEAPPAPRSAVAEGVASAATPPSMEAPSRPPARRRGARARAPE